MSRVYNFSAGPAVLPVEVLKEAAGGDAWITVDAGMSVMEMSHRSSMLSGQSLMRLKQIYGISCIFRITTKYLFLQGGGVITVCHGSDEPDEERCS